MVVGTLCQFRVLLILFLTIILRELRSSFFLGFTGSIPLSQLSCTNFGSNFSSSGKNVEPDLLMSIDISFIGSEDKISETVISWNNKAGDKDENGQEMGTAGSASVTIESDYFCATGITFENTVVAVPGGYNMQAVALRVAGDKAVFYKVHIIGTQDTLLDEVGTHYYYHSFIQGRVDFICGNAKSLFKECVLHSTAEGTGAIAAHHRNSADEDTGFSFVNSFNHAGLRTLESTNAEEEGQTEAGVHHGRDL